MAKVARRHNVRLYRPRFVYSAAETLRDFMREEIEEQFNAKEFDFYGSREVGAVAGECRYGRRYVFIMNNVVEILPDRHGSATSPEVADHPAQSPARRGDEAPPEGRILVTNLHTRAFPLIRYEIGDTGAMGAEPGGCPCGSPLPTLAKLTGRVSDHFVRRDGALVDGEYFTHLLYFRPWVESFRVDQLAHGHIRVRSRHPARWTRTTWRRSPPRSGQRWTTSATSSGAMSIRSRHRRKASTCTRPTSNPARRAGVRTRLRSRNRVGEAFGQTSPACLGHG